MMNKSTIAIKLLLILTLLLALFHVGISLQFISTEVAWGGRVKNVQQLYIVETIAFLVIGFFLFVLLMKANYVQQYLSIKLIDSVLKFFLFFFLMNTVGNLLSTSITEKLLSIATALFSILLAQVIYPFKKKNKHAIS